jgi:mono/diheme cytochrome c family protein
MLAPLHFLAAALIVLVAVAFAAADSLMGEQIYRQRCARCHGKAGEGTEENYPHALAGNRSVAQLSRYIAKSMPDDDPGTCTGEDARKVAAFIYEAFYSKAAQPRNQPPRVELSRLTVRQYREAAADLVGSFRPATRPDPRRGLQGEYFQSRGFRGRVRGRVFERLDPQVRFDFGVASPDAQKLQPHRFSIRWQGALLAPETGEYEFIVHTEHATRLWVNDLKKPLIDAWVKSGGDTEYRASIFLLGGRVFPLRLEFSKGKGGVDDSKNQKGTPPPVKASIRLEWKLPQRAPEVIPQRNLMPGQCPETFVGQTPFPPDDRSLGYERGTSVSRAWDQATTDAAIETASYVAGHLRELTGVRDDAPDRRGRVQDFCLRFAERAFRAPLTPEQKKLYMERRWQEVADVETAVKRVVLLVLKSPRFLYREPGGVSGAYDVASRMSFILWDSLPDAELRAAAAAGRLATREQVVRQAQRMMADPRTRAKLHEFLFQWLKVDQVPELSRDPRRFPGFDRAVASDLRTSLDLFLEDVVWSPDADFRRLLDADYLYLNGRLARFYGLDLPAEAPFQKVPWKKGERAGVLSHPYLLATFAYTAESSPIHRGVFLARNVLGRVLRPPPEAFTPLAPELHPKLTTRERVILQTASRNCQACHGMINPLGFTLENFDAAGRYRDREKDRPIDTTGSYQTRDGRVVKFKGLRDLATFLAGSEEVHEAFIERLFHYLVKQPIRAFGPRKLAELRMSFARNHFNIRKLVVEIVAETTHGSSRAPAQRRPGPDALRGRPRR